MMFGLLIAAAIVGKQASADDDMSIALATQPWLGYGQWYVAKDQNIFAKNGIKSVKITNFTADKDVNAALASGHVDVADVGSQTALQLIAAGLPVKIIMLEDESMTADGILANKDITSIKDLKGKRIGYEPGATSDILLHSAIKSAGLTWTDFTPAPMDADVVGAALIAGRLDIGVSYEPYISAALKQNPNLYMIYSGKSVPGLISDVLVAREDVIKNKPKALKALVKSWADSVKYYQSNPAAAQAIIAKGIGATPEELKTAFDGLHYYSGEENRTDLDGEYKDKIFPLTLKAATTAGIVQGKVTADEAIDAQFVK